MFLPAPIAFNADAPNTFKEGHLERMAHAMALGTTSDLGPEIVHYRALLHSSMAL